MKRMVLRGELPSFYDNDRGVESVPLNLTANGVPRTPARRTRQSRRPRRRRPREDQKTSGTIATLFTPERDRPGRGERDDLALVRRVDLRFAPRDLRARRLQLRDQLCQPGA